jgi:hypothetical protein
MKMMRVHLALWLVLLVSGFLLGFVPQYLQKRELQTQMQNPQKIIDGLKLQIRLGELRDLAGEILLELTRQNYGLAREHVTQYYSKLKEAIDAVEDPVLKKSLQDLFNTQDSFPTSLGAANASSVTAAQPIVSRTYEITKTLR